MAGLAVGLSGMVDAAVAVLRGRRPAPDQSPKAVCGCGDHYAHHDPVTSHCHARHHVPDVWSGDTPLSYRQQQCTCRRYVGPPPPAHHLQKPPAYSRPTLVKKEDTL